MLISLMKKLIYLDNTCCEEKYYNTIFKNYCETSHSINDRALMVYQLLRTTYKEFDHTNFYVFTTIRNPWERVVLIYETIFAVKFPKKTFDEFMSFGLEKRLFQLGIYTTQELICDIENNLLVNAVYPIEKPDEISERISKKMGIYKLQVSKEFYTQHTCRHYSEYFKNKTWRETVATVFSFDMKVGKYKFVEHIVPVPKKQPPQISYPVLINSYATTKQSKPSIRTQRSTKRIATHRTPPLVHIDEPIEEPIEPEKDLQSLVKTPFSSVKTKQVQPKNEKEIQCCVKQKSRGIQTDYDRIIDDDELKYMFEKMSSLFQPDNQYHGQSIQDIISLMEYQYL